MSEARKLAAILVADIAGIQPARWRGRGSHPWAAPRALRSELIDPIVSVHHGRIVKRTGDGSIIEFRSVVDAVRCAIEVQKGTGRAQRRGSGGASGSSIASASILATLSRRATAI